MLIIVILLILPLASHADVTEGLVGWWKFDEGSGTSAADSSGYGNTGTLTNGPTWAAGKRGGAVNFDGVNDYVALPSASLLSLSSATSEKTLAAWIKTSATNASIFGGRGYGTSDTPVFDFQVGFDGVDHANTGTMSFLIRSNNSELSRIHGVSVVSNNAWHHVVAIVDASKNMYIYVDGVREAAGVHAMTSGITVTSAGSTIGVERANGAIPAINGMIDEARVYNRALTAQEVYAVYMAGTPNAKFKGQARLSGFKM